MADTRIWDAKTVGDIEMEIPDNTSLQQIQASEESMTSVLTIYGAEILDCMYPAWRGRVQKTDKMYTGYSLGPLRLL